MGTVSKEAVIDGVEQQTIWWVEQRKAKLRSDLTDSMSLNPFLAPILFDFHNLQELPDLVSLLLAGHLMTGHSTGFGKLVDEKILPRVFGTHKLDARFRRETPPLGEPPFDNIDHLVPQEGQKPALLSLKAGKWTIQLGQAIDLNSSFEKILDQHGEEFSDITVGVFYGNRESLTDKYDILRGINRGAWHDVADVSDKVQVLAGTEFWTWLNGGERDTQQWVLDGILKGMDDANLRAECAALIESYTSGLVGRYGRYVGPDGKVDWHRLLADINDSTTRPTETDGPSPSLPLDG